MSIWFWSHNKPTRCLQGNANIKEEDQHPNPVTQRQASSKWDSLLDKDENFGFGNRKTNNQLILVQKAAIHGSL